MEKRIIKKLELTKANFCLDEPNENLILYHYKNDIHLASSGGLILISKIGRSGYSFMSAEFLLKGLIQDIDKGLNKKL